MRSSSVLATAPSPSTERARVRSVNLGDRVWAVVTSVFGCSVLAVAGLVLLELATRSGLAWKKLGVVQFLTSSDWDPVAGLFGAWPFVYGTLVTSAIAIAVAVPVAVGLGLFLSEMAPGALRRPVAYAIEVLAAIPSVIFGLWGLFVLVPWVRGVIEPALARTLGFLPLFQGPPIGLGYLAAGLILAIMILPTISSVSLEVLRTVPAPLKEGVLALGATRWESVRMVVLPYARAGIVGATLLGLGRALGETMAVTMVIGNTPEVHASLFAAGYSLPAVLANEFSEAVTDLHVSALTALGLVLFGLAGVLNALAHLLVAAVSRGPKGAPA
ncbi:MAG TPA: phosphate ABC transporter permease subunit PstC [Vicinamibacteria bacterium]|nr:phosphate ABC transporter permease subunit PstC [Vicinamibacteria bacterium]